MSLSELNKEIQNCNKCELSKLVFNRQDVKKGYGKLYGWTNGINCHFLFLGMNPSHKRFENQQYAFGGLSGSPGPGKRFNKLLRELDFFNEVFVDNIIHCSTVTNQIDFSCASACSSFLLKEIEILKPKKIIAMGKKVFEFLIKIFEEKNINLPIVCIYHPSYVFTYKKFTFQQYKEMINNVCKEKK